MVIIQNDLRRSLKTIRMTRIPNFKHTADVSQAGNSAGAASNIPGHEVWFILGGR
jgi:hypothetical protein